MNTHTFPERLRAALQGHDRRLQLSVPSSQPHPDPTRRGAEFAERLRRAVRPGR